ncbi:MAG: nucleotidyltransferase family protein [Pseudomonadota bacterium]
MGIQRRCNTTALVLAGGLGSRLRPALADRPKVLAPIGGRPFLAYLLDQLRGAGFREVVLAVGYMGASVREAFGVEYGGVKLIYSQEAEPLGTAGAVSLARPFLTSDPVLVMNGDSFVEADLGAFLNWFDNLPEAKAALLAVRVEDAGRYGRLEADSDGTVRGFLEKDPSGGPGLINAGIYLLRGEVLDSLPRGRACSLEKEIWPGLVGCGLLCRSISGRFIDIGVPESYAAAEKFFFDLTGQAGKTGPQTGFSR